EPARTRAATAIENLAVFPETRTIILPIRLFRRLCGSLVALELAGADQDAGHGVVSFVACILIHARLRPEAVFHGPRPRIGHGIIHCERIEYLVIRPALETLRDPALR